MTTDVGQPAPVPAVFLRQEASLSSSAGRFRRGVPAWAGAVRWVQILAVGVGLVAGGQAGPVDAELLARILGVGMLATLLSMVFLRGLSTTNSGWSGPARATRFFRASFAVYLAFGVLMACRALLGATAFSNGLLLEWAALSGIAASVLEHLRSAPIRVAIVGEHGSADEFACQLTGDRVSDRVEVVAILDANSERDMLRLAELAMVGTASVVILPGGSSAEAVSLVGDRLSDTPAHVLLNVSDGAPQGPFRAFMRVTAETMLFVDLLPRPIEGRNLVLKRAFDLAVTSLLVPALAPLLILVCIAIRLESPGPILFRQWRFGQASRPIRIYKFRTMAVDRSDVTGAARTVAGDPRVTRVGRILRKLSIDELPQLLNVLQGDMSLVGPRPHATHMKVEGAYYFDAVNLYRVRHRVLPGITGWAQINESRGEVDTLAKARRRLELDLWYVANWSPFLDLWIVLRTLTGGFLNVRGD